MAHSPPRILLDDACVNELIDSDTLWWRANLLREIFYEVEIKAIQSIPISATGQPDVQIW